MDSHSHASDSERERYERIAAAAAELAQLLMTLHTVLTLDARDMSPLVVENITALIDDAVALAPSTPEASRPRPTSPPTRGQPGTAAPRSGHEDISELDRIDAAAADTSISLARAISDARRACAALARAGGRDLALLYAIAATLNRISTCYQTLGQLTYNRTRIASSLAETGRATRSINTYTSVRRAPYEAYPPTISFTSPPAPARDNHDQLRRGPRITGPTGF